MWTYLTQPFTNVLPGFETQEIDPWNEKGERWRRLRVTWPERPVGHSRVQTLYISDARARFVASTTRSTSLVGPLERTSSRGTRTSPGSWCRRATPSSPATTRTTSSPIHSWCRLTSIRSSSKSGKRHLSGWPVHERNRRAHDDVRRAGESHGEIGDGLSFAYRDTGGDERPVVLFQHFRGNLDNWDPALIDDLAAKRRVITFDYEGVGGSEGRIAHTIAETAEGSLRFLDAMNLEQVDVLGFSIGSFVAQEIALTRPSMAQKVVLASSAPKGAS